MLRPQDIGVLAALGIVEVEVFSAPRVATDFYGRRNCSD